jgi:hypothetical protein
MRQKRRSRGMSTFPPLRPSPSRPLRPSPSLFVPLRLSVPLCPSLSLSVSLRPSPSLFVPLRLSPSLRPSLSLRRLSPPVFPPDPIPNLFCLFPLLLATYFILNPSTHSQKQPRGPPNRKSKIRAQKNGRKIFRRLPGTPRDLRKF